MNVYVASSWKNTIQPIIVQFLRDRGYEVYDFRHPEPGNDGFSWSAVDENWRGWTPAEYRIGLRHSAAAFGFALDFEAMRRADFCVLVLPSGRSAHIEAGYFVGAGKKLFILLEQNGQITPELMYLMANDICIDMKGLEAAIPKPRAAE
jgi:hypothetical protein